MDKTIEQRPGTRSTSSSTTLRTNLFTFQ